MDRYSDIVNSYLFTDREPEYSVLQLSSQLFVVPSVAGNLVETQSALTHIVCILASFFTEQIDITTRTLIFPGNLASLTIDPESPAFKHKRYTYLFADLGRLLATPAVMQYVARTPRLLDFFASFVGLFEGMNPNSRMLGEHVEYESEVWVSAFNLSMHMSKCCKAMGRAITTEGSTQDILEALAVLFRRTWQRTEGEGESAGHATTTAQYAKEAVAVSMDAVSLDPTSFHHPTLWLFAEVAKNASAVGSTQLAAAGPYRNLVDWMQQTLGQHASPDRLLLLASEQPLRG
jgi:E3 ubiquitin-protein ligase UBR1